MATSLNKELWIADVQERLYEGYGYMAYSQNHNAFVSNKTVNIPLAGAQPGIVVDRSTFPATATQRTDTVLAYDLNSYTTDPILITDAEVQFIAYDKRSSILNSHVATLNESIVQRTLNKWAPENTSNVVLSTGTAFAAATGDMPTSATGNRKQITKADILDLRKRMNRDKVPQNGRVLVITPGMEAALLALDEFVRADAYGSAQIPDGLLGRIYGFDVFVSNLLPVFNGSTGALKAFGAAAVAASDTFGALAWQRDFVAKAESGITAYADNDNPLYYGDVLSMQLFQGGSKLRAASSSLGSYAIVQAV